MRVPDGRSGHNIADDRALRHWQITRIIHVL